jgi:polyphosphate glucokinase
MAKAVLGIDIGGSGIKAAPVDVRTGELLDERRRVTTPRPATPGAIARAVAETVRAFRWKGPVGCALPAVVKARRARTAANISPKWLGLDVVAHLGEACGRPVTVVNDADAAGCAEMAFGAGRRKRGLVVMVTLGTGIGTALFMDGRLIPNTELGHLTLRGRDAETWAAARLREEEKLGWQEWASRVDAYLDLLHRYLWPDLFILGGGVSRNADEFLRFLEVPVPVVPAALRNNAGLIGAALVRAKARRL